MAKIVTTINCTNIDEVTTKAKELIGLLEQVKKLLREISEWEL